MRLASWALWGELCSEAVLSTPVAATPIPTEAALARAVSWCSSTLCVHLASSCFRCKAGVRTMRCAGPRKDDAAIT